MKTVYRLAYEWLEYAKLTLDKSINLETTIKKVIESASKPAPDILDDSEKTLYVGLMVANCNYLAKEYK